MLVCCVFYPSGSKEKADEFFVIFRRISSDDYATHKGGGQHEIERKQKKDQRYGSLFEKLMRLIKSQNVLSIADDCLYGIIKLFIVSGT